MAADEPENHHRLLPLTQEGMLDPSASAIAAIQSRGAGARGYAASALDKKVPPTATVVVNCTKGDSINDALTTPAVTLTIQVHGICTENVVITRDYVTLAGTSPSTDGIRGDPSSAHGPAVVAIIGEAHTHIEQLSIANGPNGLFVRNAEHTWVSNCDVSGATVDGIVSSNTEITITNTTIHDNGRAGLSAWQAGDLFCDSCTISANKQGAMSISGARLGLSHSSVQANRYALIAQQHGWLSFDTGSFAGSIDAEDQSTVLISAATQTADPGGFYASVNSIVVANNGSVLFGPVWGVFLDQFSNLNLLGGSTITGNLECHSGANAFCENSAGVSGSTAGCSACVKP
jgi:hypothetical protein